MRTLCFQNAMDSFVARELNVLSAMMDQPVSVSKASWAIHFRVASVCQTCVRQKFHVQSLVSASAVAASVDAKASSVASVPCVILSPTNVSAIPISSETLTSFACHVRILSIPFNLLFVPNCRNRVRFLFSVRKLRVI